MCETSMCFCLVLLGAGVVGGLSIKTFRAIFINHLVEDTKKVMRLFWRKP